MAGKLARGIGIARHMGIGWCAYRGVYELARRSGWLRLRSPARPWEAFSLDRVLSDPSLAEPESLLDRRRQGSRFLFDSARLTGAKGRFEAWDAGEETPQSIQLAESVLAGRIRFFEHSVHALGFPPDWHRDPYTGARVSAEAHWSQVPLLGASDIKAVWEANRFGWAYALARAYARTHDDRYAEAFWVALEDWCDRNPPGLGPHYACGQEVSLRVMAWAFALHAFMDSPATTADRVARMLQALGASGQRIEANIGYALSQRNNHGLSEGAGLFTLGAVFPEFRAARRWLTRGHRVIERLSRELIDEDGAFSQHSANYHRVALQVLSWTVALGDRAGHPLSDVARERLGRLASLLRAIQDETSGRVPCFGQNDGALVLPLSNCGYEDFRPALAGAWHVATGGRLYEDGPWDEECWWLGGATEPGAGCDGPTARAVGDTSALVSGYFAIRSNEGMAFTRCGRFRHRPAQADVLHVDIWWRGTNVACDAGTYSYNQPPPWDGGLGGTSYHNAVTVDGCDQMERAERFLWLPWVRGSCSGVRRSPCGLLACLEGSHDGYSRLHPAVSYRRAVILLPGEGWLVLDRMRSAGPHSYRLHWLCPDLPHECEPREAKLCLTTPSGPYAVQMGVLPVDGAAKAEFRCSLVRADPESPRGWRSRYYLDREPALSFDLTVEAHSIILWSLLSPGLWPVAPTSSRSLAIEGPGGVARVSAGAEDGPLVARVEWVGTVEDSLEAS